MSLTQSPEESIKQSLSAMNAPPTVCGNLSVAASSDILFADSVIQTDRAKRSILVHNYSSNTANVGLFFIASGASATGLSLSNALVLEPGNACSLQISSKLRVAAVSSSGTVQVNVLVYDS